MRGRTPPSWPAWVLPGLTVGAFVVGAVAAWGQVTRDPVAFVLDGARRLRDQVDLDQVTAGLRDTVVATAAPTRDAVWLHDVPSPREA